ncbi:hypothetical protein FPZ24_10535 [Sphingomonas panacisoli]|uniref:Alginate export domain-containing protein n=2 Tax=Sphingomonas panacisoli TaxID=1813879 RepID=A0A5B8LN57_9SPHN|nr:alginate export family protein [Sphingomonas panacisoli]QDZ09145.1 hypothetical protein FPZ24_10535 [Sphingomonas panacisoli]
MTQVAALALLAAGVCADAAAAQDIKLTPLIDARLRYEHVDQEGVADQADAVTMRMRTGIQAKAGPLTALVEAEATLKIAGAFNNGLNGRPLPVIPDPNDVEINRVQFGYEKDGLALIAGRQVLELGDQRFVGSANWRQNQQTFDAVRAKWTHGKLSVDAAYSWDVRTVNGIDGKGARPRSVSGNNWFGQIGYATPIGTLGAFAYLVDQNLSALSGYRLSNQTYGLRLTGVRQIAKGWKLAYVASIARQSDYARNPNRYAATYYLGEATLSGPIVSATAGYEVLGADRGVALTSIQTPLASFFKFQGWASKFTTTPPDGLRDLYGTIGGSWKSKGMITGYGVAGTYHRFASDRLVRLYGDEIDAIGFLKFNRYTLAARLARYVAKGFATDTTKVFLTLDWVM